LVLEHPSTCSCALFRSIAPNFSRVWATRERQTLNLTNGEFKKRGTYQPSTRICCLCYLMANCVALEATAKIFLDTCTFHPDQQCTPSSQHIGGYDAHTRTHAHIHTHTLYLWRRLTRSESVNFLRRSIRSHCNTLQHTATHCNILQHTSTTQHTAAHCSTLQHTAAHCSTLQHTTAHRNTHAAPNHVHTSTVQHAATHRNTLQHTATHMWYSIRSTRPHCNTWQHAAARGNILRHTASRCNTPHHPCSA